MVEVALVEVALVEVALVVLLVSISLCLSVKGGDREWRKKLFLTENPSTTCCSNLSSSGR